MSQDPGPELNSGEPARSTEFLHRSVADALRRRLTEGRLADGSKLPALREIAEEYDVSTMTVRQALRTLEQEGHVYRIPGVGAFVRPSSPGKSVAQRALAFVGADLGSPFQVAVARGVQRACQRRGWAIQILDAHFDAEIEARNVQRLPESGARGAVVLPPLSDARTLEMLVKFHSADFPLVLVDQTVPGLRVDLVASDHEAGTYRATTHLLEHGHTRVLLLTHRPESSSVAARIVGYNRALWAAGIESLPEWKAWIDPRVHLSGYREHRKWFGGYKAILPLLKDLAPPVGVVAVDAYTGWGVYEACHELGLRIPDDVSVVAFDDLEIAHAVRPPMTIVSQRTDEIGRLAIDLLLRCVEVGRREHEAPRALTHTVVDVDLIERESVAFVTGG